MVGINGPGVTMTEFSILRQAAGLTVPKAAQIAGIATSTAYRWEHGEVAALTASLDKLRAAAQPIAAPAKTAFRFVDLFAGIGGLRRGFDAIGGTCVCTAEWDRFAQATYRANYRNDGPDHRFLGDITKVDASDIPAHDVLLAGFPCQPFCEQELKETGLQSYRDLVQGTLFFDVVLAIHHHMPRFIVLENFKEMLTFSDGKTFALMRHTLEKELGYDLGIRCIDARSVVPMRRERVYIVGVRRDLGHRLDFGAMDLPDPAKGPRLGSILHTEDGKEIGDPDFTNVDGTVADRYNLSDGFWKSLQGYAEKHHLNGNGFGYDLVGPSSIARGLSQRYHKDGSQILVDRGSGRNPRRLTPRECARLVGFDRAGENGFIIPVSDTQAYIQFGNATIAPISLAVAKHMESSILATR